MIKKNKTELFINAKILIGGLSLSLCSNLIHAKHHAPICEHKKDMTAITECWTKTTQKLDQDLELTWQKIMNMPQEKSTFDKKKAQEAQNLWKQFRQIDCTKYNQGSIAPIMNAKCYYAITKARMHEFKHMCRGLGDTPIC